MGFLSRLFVGAGHRPRDLLTDLTEDYVQEAEQATLLREHADKARYPQAASQLRRLADVETRHSEWLRDRLIALGGRVPVVEPRSVAGQNQWERAAAAHRLAQAKRRRLVEQIAHWDPEEPEVVALLHRIEQEDQQGLVAYDELIMRSDPQAID